MLSQAAYDRSNTLPLMLALACALLCAGCGAPNEGVGGGSLSVEARVAAGSDARPLDGETLYLLGADIAIVLEQSKPLWETRVVRTARTDERGRAVFDKLAPGHYWLMCLSERDGKLAFWGPRVTVARARTEAVVLDQSNALTFGDSPARR